MKWRNRFTRRPPVKLGRRLVGVNGTAVDVHVLRPMARAQEATVGSWFLTCPLQSPAWDRYLLSAVHLRPIPGAARPKLRFHEATHEIVLMALDPDRDPVEDDPRTWGHLLPLNFADQVTLPSDEAARFLLTDLARAVVDGLLWAEPPLSGQVEPWSMTVAATAAHYRGEHQG